MPDERFFHKRLGHSAKVNSLTDFEFRVWTQYELSADDCGVLRRNAVTLQADNDSLAARSPKLVQRALERIISVGLLLTFEHQGQRFVCQHDWQNYQRVRYPRPTIHPPPPQPVLKMCTPETRRLFQIRHGGFAEQPPETSGELSVNPPNPAGAGGRERLTANGNGNEGGMGETAKRAGAFVEWYEDTHQRLFGIGYMGVEKDWQKTLELCAKFTDGQLRDAAIVWFGHDDDFATNGTRTIVKFASRVSGCLQQARKQGIA